MRYSNCIDCSTVILPKSVRCRSCYAQKRKDSNRITITFLCPVCHEPFAKADRGDIKNATVVYCSSNCHETSKSYYKIIGKLDRNKWALARRRARACIYKLGVKPNELPARVLNTMVRLYIAREVIREKAPRPLRV